MPPNDNAIREAREALRCLVGRVCPGCLVGRASPPYDENLEWDYSTIPPTVVRRTHAFFPGHEWGYPVRHLASELDAGRGTATETFEVIVELTEYIDRLHHALEDRNHDHDHDHSDDGECTMCARIVERAEAVAYIAPLVGDALDNLLDELMDNPRLDEIPRADVRKTVVANALDWCAHTHRTSQRAPWTWPSVWMRWCHILILRHIDRDDTPTPTTTTTGDGL